ncbi:MAG: hypothetical protein KC420_10615 [Myxococcales bacterium]|nr:hypothetical protein [Myxococcales bacterium]MCB9703464.1 hypothetical protein [Myxococcales bacterium]
MNEVDDRVEDAWTQSLRDVLREVIRALPDTATLGEIVAAARKNDHISPVLGVFTVQELIDIAKERPRPQEEPAQTAVDDDLDEAGDLELGPAVIRRRADVPGGDALVLRSLSKSKAGRRESELLQGTGLASDQLRLVLRHLRTKGLIHVEGSGAKKRIKITRAGSTFLRSPG